MPVNEQTELGKEGKPVSYEYLRDCGKGTLRVWTCSSRRSASENKDNRSKFDGRM